MEPQNDYWLFTANKHFEVGIQRMGWELVQTISTMEFVRQSHELLHARPSLLLSNARADAAYQ